MTILGVVDKKSMNVNDVIGVLVDLKKYKLTFMKNKEIIAVIDLPKLSKLYPAVSPGSMYNSLSLAVKEPINF